MPDEQVLTRTLALALSERKASEPTGMSFDGIAVPYGVDAKADGFVERFAQGAVPDGSLTGLAVYWNHDRSDMPVGLISSQTNADDGAHITVDLSDTSSGRDAAALLRDGVIRGLSISFVPDEMRMEQDGSITHLSVTPKEVSLTGFPAYRDAAVTKVRSLDPIHQETHMPEKNTTEQENAELRSSLDDLTRRLKLMESGADHTGPATKFRSLGHVLKGIAERSVTMDDLTTIQGLYRDAQDRAYSGTTTASSVVTAAWIDRDIKLVDKGRPLVNLFNHQTMPDSGLSLEYPVVDTVTDATGKQAAEGDALGMVTLKLKTGTATIDTVGNALALTRQTIERSTVSYLDKALNLQRIFYGKYTNSALRSVLTAASGVIAGDSIAATLADPKAWIGVAVDAVAAIDDQSTTGLQADAWIMSTAHFKSLATVVDSADRPVFSHRGDGSNTIGGVNVTGLAANVEGLPVLVDPGLTGNTSYIVSSQALTTWESEGAPANLAQDDILTLSKAFAIYGFLAYSVDDPKGIYTVTMAV